jgi:hypothetical protein
MISSFQSVKDDRFENKSPSAQKVIIKPYRLQVHGPDAFLKNEIAPQVTTELVF